MTAATGTASMTVGVFTSPARDGFGPQLALGYDSGAGQGAFGLGWGLGVPAITRKTSRGLPRYDDAANSDVFMLSGADDLVPLLVESASGWAPDSSTREIGDGTYAVRRYRPRVESGFTRIERWQDTASGDVHWRTITSENVTSLFGRSGASRIADPADPARIFSWLLDLSFDDRGNAISYVYNTEDRSGAPRAANEGNRVVGANRYLKRVQYGNETPYLPGVERWSALPTRWSFELVLDYGEHDPIAPSPVAETAWACRPDPFSSYRSGFEVRTYRTCRRLLMFHRMAELGTDAVLVRSTDLTYETGEPGFPSMSLLASVTQTGWRAAVGGGYETSRLPSLVLGYNPLSIDGTLRTADVDTVENFTGSTGERWIDLDGEGLSGILTEHDSAWYYKHNVSTWDPDGGPANARFEPLSLVGSKPAPGSSFELTDLNGDGNLCAVSFEPPTPGWYEYDADAGWGPFKTLAATANVDWTSPNLRFVDLDGDGVADVLITEDDALSWHEWLIDTGFAPADRVAKPFDEERGPAVVFADPLASIFLADMSGDGLTDIVRVRNREVCYWPNLGYGRFGAKVAMDGAPAFDFTDRFDARQLRLADIDGSGTADLIYLSGQATIWFNQSGNSWTDGYELSQFPSLDADVQVNAFDLLGTGTACLVWTSPLPGDATAPLRYIDLTGGVKPHLLTSVTNNLGVRRTLRYAPSTKFYLQDRAAGTPWLTRLPFPVHVVERLQTDDAISRTTYAQRYSYHHGFYDGVEREFRGFARVDVLDADSLPSASGTGTFTSTPAADGETFMLAPVWTRTWYHTGAFFDRADLAACLAHEYYALDPQAPALGPTILPAGVSAEAVREACRALRGRVLREEVYARDGTPASLNPYLTSEHRYEVDLLQPPTATSYGGFHTWERESIGCHYERNPTDPRVTHELSLAIDAYGNLTRHASVGYPRRQPAYPEQGATVVRYSERDFANHADQPDSYRLGLPTETRTYELTGIAPNQPGELFAPDALASAATAATEIPYEAVPDGTTPQRRMLAAERTIYRRDDLSGVLPLGQADSLAIVDQTFSMRSTQRLLSAIFGAKLTGTQLASLLSGPAAFVDLDGDGGVWAPSPRMFYSADPADPDADYARGHFYLPQGAVDPWGNVSTVAYDDHDLLVTRRTDAAGNTTLAQSNYRVLRPWLLTDPNLNRSGVRYDALGMIVATAAMGKLQADGTDEGDHLDTGTAEPSPSDDPTVRLDYNLSAYATWAANMARYPDHPQPAYVHTRARVRHRDPATPWIESYTYTDGLGRVALTKAQAEAGVAPDRDAAGQLVRDARGGLVFASTDCRWVGSGRVVYDNKGNPVKSYEPFFDTSPVYDDETDLVQWGVTSITRYDPVSRAIRVDNPNGTYRTVEFDPWHSATFDENDTVLDSAWYAARSSGQLGANETDAATKAAAHADTPASTDLDTLGRAFRSVADNGPGGAYATILTLDIDGRVLVTTDALGRAVLTQQYDMAGDEIHQLNVDSGERWMLTDVAGQPLQAWDSRGFNVVTSYDSLRRPTILQVTEHSAAPRVAEQIIYGEGLADAQARNLRGAIYQHRDEAGIATTQQRDFDGNILSASRQLLEDYVDDVDWLTDPALSPEVFPTADAYDALGRITATTTPDGSITVRTYNQRSLLVGVAVNVRGAAAATTVVEGITYDAKGQRQSIAYGNGARTAYTYDPETFRLTKLTTTRPGTSPLQDLGYTHDPVGNVTRLTDAAQQTIFFNGQVVTPSADYSYDAIYRLTVATGREHIGQTTAAPVDWDDSARLAIPLPTDGQAMRNYTETYTYDAVGNIGQLAHAASAGGFTRTYAYDEPNPAPTNNRLTSTTVAGRRERYTFDADGNIVSLPHLSLMKWDWKDQLAASARQVVTEGSPETTYYRYGCCGQRIRKRTDNRSGSCASERIYLGAFEIYRRYGPGGSVTLERETLHITDGTARICLLETATVSTAAVAVATPSTLIRYELANHLGSVALELDDSAALITYEEFYPYGSTSYQGVRRQTVARKRYRHTAKERDDENALYYYGARYYIPWLGIWLSCDPKAMTDATSPYVYCRSNPTSRTDKDGADSWCIFCNPFSDDVEFDPGGAVKAVASQAVEGSEIITGAISRGTTAAGNWVSDQANDASAWLDERGHPWLASATRGAGVVAATATKTVGEVGGQILAAGPNAVLALHSGGQSIGIGAGRIATADDWMDATLGTLEILRGAGQGAQVALDAISMTESWGSGTIEKAGPSPTVTENKIHGDAFRDQNVRARATPWRESANEVTVRPNVGPGRPGTKADNFRLDTLERSKITGGYKPVEAKGTATAPLTRKQAAGFPKLERFGGQVVGKKGGSMAPHGTQLPPMRVEITRPLKLFLQTVLPPTVLNMVRTGRSPNSR